MDPIRFVVARPVTVLVGVFLLVLFGGLSIARLPIQLTPDVDIPLITVTTHWEGAAPQEIESEILEEQEERLKSVPGLRQMISTAVEGGGTVTLEFDVGTDIARKLFEVDEKLQQVPSYPENVDKPSITSGETKGSNAIAWFILEVTPDSPVDPAELPYYRTLIVEEVQPIMGRSQGIAGIGLYGGVEREVQIRVDPFKLAARQITPSQLRTAIRTTNLDLSGGSIDSGKFSALVRTSGKYKTLAEIRETVIVKRKGQPVFLGDVASVDYGHKDAQAVVRNMSKPAIAMSATKQSGTNLISVMEDLQRNVDFINKEVLRPKGIQLRQVYDQTEYVFSAIGLVTQNLWVGGLLAMGVLLLFLRSLRSTLVIAVAIPTSVIGAFLGLEAMGRNLNVVSLAGLAFAVGMVVDNSIVVLENIYRHRQMGKGAFEAAYDGATEVWGAVVASTLTTLAVFLPVIFVQEEAGQLFRDIAIAISSAVATSLAISVLFIPMASARLSPTQRRNKEGRKRRFSPLRWLIGLGERFTKQVSRSVAWINSHVALQLGTVLGITFSSLLLAWLLLPPATYLPDGNRNLVLGFLIPPPGYNSNEFLSIAEQVESTLEPFYVEKADELPPELRRPAWFRGNGEIPGISQFFFVTFNNTAFMGAKSPDASNVPPLAQLLMYAGNSIAGTRAFALQSSLFSPGLSSGNSIDLEITGPDLDVINRTAGMVLGRCAGLFGPRSTRPEPTTFGLESPEYRIILDQARARDLGLNVQELGFFVRAMSDGAIISDYRTEGLTLDVKLMPPQAQSEIAESLDQLPIWTDLGRTVPISAVARVEETTAPTTIRRLEEQRAVRLTITAPPKMPLSVAMAKLQEEILSPMREAGQVPASVKFRLAGNADKLAATGAALQWNLILAILITFLLLSALFESFLYPIVIMLSVPLAGVGGVVGLDLTSWWTGQQLDILTMLGFVILIGTVVNNAILIVHQALQNIRNEGMSLDDAIQDSVRTRVRPIFMSTSTSVLGMMPLVLFPGAGSELYRGLGSVVVGGLIASTLLTLVLVPTLFHLFYSAQERGFAWLGSRSSASQS
ncbi:MAG: acriflavin resistance protein [Planctomycetota bacterium]|nr:MAG: acriflavin resistance protein [Planctomycetota bacterium]